jgi:ABC-type taurine transport system substrate-binding protein
MFYRDVALSFWYANCAHYLDLMIKDEAIKTPMKKIIAETSEYIKNTSNHIDNVLEEYSIFLHKSR